MSSFNGTPRRVTARRVLALGATSAAVLGGAAAAAPVPPRWVEGHGLVQRAAAEGEGAESAVAAESEGEGHEAGAESEGEGEAAAPEAKPEADAAPTVDGGENEGAAGPEAAPEVLRARALVVIAGRLRAAQALSVTGGADVADLVEEAAESAEHDLAEPLADSLYDQIGALETGGSMADPAAVLDQLATAGDDLAPADRIEAMPMALRSAAGEYEQAFEDGKLTDRTAYLEAWGIFQGIQATLDRLAGAGDARASQVAAKMRDQLAEAGAAFGGPEAADIADPDASLLYGVAARMEFTALTLR